MDQDVHGSTINNNSQAECEQCSGDYGMHYDWRERSKVCENEELESVEKL